MSEREAIAAAYRRFAADEAHGRSPLYENLAYGVADDAELLDFLLTLPRAKRQPNLLLAAARVVAGVADGWETFRRGVLAQLDAVRAVMLRRSTQTNEPGRCAVLLPVLARLPQPLALIEVGASAGLCLLPDRYGYEYGGRLLRSAVEQPVFACAANTATPLPDDYPRVVWRAGLDLNPIDVTQPEQTEWLEALVWPEQADRLARLHAALAIARRDPPRLVRGDLRHDLAALAAAAPRDATLVIFHTAVVAYVADRSERQDFARTVRGLCHYWIANEAPVVFPDMPAPSPVPPGRFLLSLNGTPLAWSDPHGASIEWFAASRHVRP